MGDGLDLGNVTILLPISGVEEEIGKGFLARSIGGVIFTADFVDDRNGEIANPVFEVFDLRLRESWVGVGSDGLIKGAVDDDGGRSYSSLFDGFGVGNETKEVVVAVSFSGGLELFYRGVGGSIEIGKDDNLVSLLEFLEFVLGNFRDSRERLSEKWLELR